MFHLTLRTIGKLQETWQQEAVENYVKRLSPFARTTIQELAEQHGGSAKPDTAKTIKLEGESLLKTLPSNAVILALDETGKELDSVAFAQKIETLGGQGQPLVFIVGGSWGLDASVRARADFVLSLGKMTLPHALARITLLEQLYRAMTILKGKTYHK